MSRLFVSVVSPLQERLRSSLAHPMNGVPVETKRERAADRSGSRGALPLWQF
ncbi:hypothetical protein GBL_0073 [Geobacillus kaustophilus GBlys]|uniref:Uncharacterized protein n=2 Tax=Geobacillus kaustophilus TaxID=1462 RepID=Q5KW25_GEOKA|nr:hypothetical protein [Geobacillus zalihae]QNU25989.1 hypothetical protein IC806_07160 [Geobacillus zalihae]BAD77111.1 hypothetical protein GK2826 [Geobacillus kaustophilus HTA426]GAD11856.1 hypothetical protein GBL_0073 [Geobacillus kaustophilus GBlys]